MDYTINRLITGAGFEAVDGSLKVSAIDPLASMQGIDNAALHAVAGQVRDLLAKAVEEI
ncbi:hypothetical protein [Phaeovulum sp. W22_SRMD_FR3]|uniref:hypothetical protein n=1 Tax=Phaeovulum sp. W22_SRMD_FR3 TaxID=3240274 RepID=UPI003F9D5CD3